MKERIRNLFYKPEHTTFEKYGGICFVFGLSLGIGGMFAGDLVQELAYIINGGPTDLGVLGGTAMTVLVFLAGAFWAGKTAGRMHREAENETPS